MLPKSTHLTLCVLLLCVFAHFHTNAFNYAPLPNINIMAPDLKFFKPQERSSYFGYSMVIRPDSIFVGAPRAQSTLESQRNINETGAIYRCSLKDSSCAPYVLENKGNLQVATSEYSYNSEKRDFQWLGASMDGGTKDTDKLLVCAPRFITPTYSEYFMHGICYWVNDTLSTTPTNVVTISPLRGIKEQIMEERGHRYYFYALAEQGLSAHVTANNEEFIIGAPGIHNWKGSIIQYRKTKYLDGTLSMRRRDLDGRRVTRQIETLETYSSFILAPSLWDQQNDSYFGYAVGSGYFDSNNRKHLMYVATAPQADLQSGEAYLFDIVLLSEKTYTIAKKFVFRGQQFGEYFGYAVLTEDLNDDGLTDVIISAPQYSISGSFEDGAIYVFTNQGNFNFERKLLTSPVLGNVRFGTTLSKLGSINGDRYNDIAVGAPFAGNGAVFIYLGNENGLRAQHSQHLKSPSTLPSTYGAHMFGHGLSKGADIDGNGFNDFAIGAPNAEAVFVYRAYPVVKILANVQSQSREIKPEQTTFKITVNYAISTVSKQVKNQDLALRLVADPQVKRVKFIQTGNNEINFNVSAGLQEQSRALDCQVHFVVTDIFKPIELDLYYNIINGVPNSDVFCEKCAAVDPAEPKMNTFKIIFSTGCKSDICVADLEVKSYNFEKSFVVGSSRTLTITYDVINNGETAYLPQINITSVNRIPFAKIPSNCPSFNEDYMLCNLNNGRPMARGSRDTIRVAFDVHDLSGKAITIKARAFSTGKELNPINNEVTDIITLTEFTEVDVSGIPKTPHMNLEKMTNISEVINNYEIRSIGPSTVGTMEVIFDIPVAYRITGSSATVEIINMSNIHMQAVYDSQLVGIDFYQGNAQIFMDTLEALTVTRSSSSSSRSDSSFSSSTTITKVSKTNANSIHYDSAKMGMFEEQPDYSLSDTMSSASLISHRTRREAAAQTATKDQYARIAKAHDLLSEDLKGTLPVNRTIVFNCNDHETTICVRAIMTIHTFKPEKPIAVTMKYQVDLKEVNQVLIEPWEFFVILIGLDVKRVGDISGNTMAIRKHIEYNIISKHQLSSLPIWVIILAVLGGLLLLALMAYGMYKMGFFKRAKREEMDKLVNQGPAGGADVEPEAENLNSESN